MEFAPSLNMVRKSFSEPPAYWIGAGGGGLILLSWLVWSLMKTPEPLLPIHAADTGRRGTFFRNRING